MKIIHTMPDIDKEASGPSYSVIRLCESLLDLGAESRVALIGKGVKTNYIRAFSPGHGPARLGRSPEMWRWLKATVNAGEVDVVHNHGLWMMPNVYPGWATRGRDIPYVVSPRGTLSNWAMRSGSKVKRIFWPLVQRPAIVHASCFHATAEAEYEDIRRMGLKQPVAIIPNGIDLPGFADGKPRRHRRTLLFLGRLHPVKGIDSLLKAWRLLQDAHLDWDLRIVGPDHTADANALRSLAVGLGVKRVDFAGPAYGADKFDAYRRADLYVLPTHSENFGMTVAESLACGTPVIVSRGAPWGELPLRQAGWWPEIGLEPLLQSLQAAMSLPSTVLDQMGQNGRQWMHEEFAWPSIARKMYATYEWLLGRAEKPDCVELV